MIKDDYYRCPLFRKQANMAELFQFGEFVTNGEELTAHYLRDNLPKNWFIITNKLFVMPNRSTREVDFLIVGENRIFVADEKGYRGRIHGNETYWVLDSRESLSNPLNNMEMVARKVAGYIRDQIPHLDSNLTGHFVLPTIILSHETAEVFIQEPRRERIMRLPDVEQVLRAMDRRGRDENSIADFRNLILDKLRVLPLRPSLPKNINSYKILEALPSGPHYRSYMAEHDAGGQRRLKLYELSGLGDAERKQQKELIYRDFHAANRAMTLGISTAIDPPFTWGDERYIVVPQHILDFPSLRFLTSDANKTPLTLLDAITLGEALFDALAKLHDLGILHRNLTPDNTFVDMSLETARVFLTDLDFARISEGISIASSADNLFQDSPYRAPELSVGLAFANPASDLFSAGMILAEVLSGESAESFRSADGISVIPTLQFSESSLGLEESQTLHNMLQQMVKGDDRERWQSAHDARAMLNQLRKSLMRSVVTGNQRRIPDSSDIKSEVVEIPSPTPASRDGERRVFQVGDVIADQFMVERILGAGATAVTYLVSDIFYGGDRSVLKVIKDPLTTRHLAGAEYRALKGLHHRAIPRVLDARPPSADFHLRLEFVDGIALSDLSEEFPWPLSRVLEFGETILDALCLLEKNGLAHRDISSRNILVGEAGPKLIDFGFATIATTAHTTLVGTPAFRAPELDSGMGWNGTCDTYALGVILFWMATGKFPFAQDLEGRFDKSQIVTPESLRIDDHNPEIHEALIHILRRAISPKIDDRYPDASVFRDSLRSVSSVRAIGVPAEGNRADNPWVRDIQGLYRNSRVGNADNRGLDTDFAEDTYVETRLDNDLIPSVLEGKYQVVLLSGNPGDGKTAWLEKLGRALEDAGADALSYDLDNGWKYSLNGHTFAANFDASESSKGKRADELLDEILKPMRGIEPPSGRPYTALIAINDGKLREFVLNNPEYRWLGQQVFRLLEQEDHKVDSRIALVDLKQRSVVGNGSNEVEADLFEKVLLKMVDSEGWDVCQECRARERCTIKFNRDTLVDKNGGSVVRQRLRALLQITHLRGERHITMRDLRSVLSYIVAGTATCNDIHREMEEETFTEDWYNRLYFMAAFNPESESEDNLKDFAAYDPAGVTTPPLDRFLHYRRSEGRNPIDIFTVPIPGRSSLPLAGLSFSAFNQRWYEANKRRMFFEANADSLSSDASPPVTWTGLLPYRHFAMFLNMVTGKLPMSEVRAFLCEAISRANGIVDEKLYGRYLCIRTSRNEIVDLTVFKRFPQEDFDCRVITPRAEKVEILPNSLELRHIQSDARIVIGLDLFEILMRFNEGYEPGAEEQQPFVIDLAQFQNLLLNQMATELLLLEAGRKLHGVRQQDGIITLLSMEEINLNYSNSTLSSALMRPTEDIQALI
ncbi:MAG: protein kinase [Armatimonas sp.]